jgi:hypothetical protein
MEDGDVDSNTLRQGALAMTLSFGYILPIYVKDHDLKMVSVIDSLTTVPGRASAHDDYSTSRQALSPLLLELSFLFGTASRAAEGGHGDDPSSRRRCFQSSDSLGRHIYL